jgi:hypothetical protein
MHPDRYASAGRLPQCRTAGGKSRRYNVDTYRQRHETGAGAPRPCRCHWYSFPHHKGRGFCIHNRHLTQAQVESREAYA